MYSQPLPTTTAPSPGNEDDGSVKKREDFSEKINLDLGIGIGRRANEKIKQEKREPFFSSPQFHQVHNQILVCNSSTSGLLPLFIGFCPKSSDQTSTMGTEPGRCRRTDGRKWRCTKNAIPHQKYCDRHVNRGRRNSRKHTSTPIEGVPIPNNKTSDISNPSNLNPSEPHPSRSSSNALRPINFGHKNDENTHGLLAIPRKIINKEHNVAKNNYVGFVSPLFGLSPKSVLLNDAGSKSIMEASPQRCRRTDGKKWQCKRDAVSNQKYCDVHMRRGAKRLASDLESSDKVPEASRRRAHISCNNRINLNTVAAIHQRHVTENDSTSSSTSDATTITD